METTRYITTQAVLDDNKQLIPLWDERVVFTKTDLYGSVITLKGGASYDERKFRNVEECILDVKTKTLSMGIEVDIYPEKTKYEIHDIVCVKKDGTYDNVLVETKITDIIYESYDLTIRKGKKLDNYDISAIKKVLSLTEIDIDTLYAIKRWKPIYLLENGMKIEYDMYIYKFAK